METASNARVPHGVSEASDRQGNGHDDPNKKPNVRKRTKTGCLTCRRRRIKCDEGRPTCANCIKSKRVCEGYNPRVVFKEPLSASQGPFQSSGYGGNHAGDIGSMHAQFARSGMRPSLTPIAPRPPIHPGHSARHDMRMGMSEDVFFSQQPAISTLQSQYFDFNNYNCAESLEPPPMLPNPLMAPDYGNGMPVVASHARSNQANWQDELVLPYAIVVPPIPEPVGHHVSHYDDEDDDAMSISDDGLIEAANSRGLQTLTKTWNGARADARKYDFFAQCGALFSYMDSPANSELRNQGEITVFSYFLNITSPTISMYERHPCDPVEKQEFHSKGHNLWAYTLPVIAFHHPGLLHAMLALASFQLARIQGQTHVAAIRHYSRAIRRVARNVNSPSRRTHLATIAATLLLGYFEVWMADHKNWCKHLNGASILLREIPLQARARRCLPKRRQSERQRSLSDPTFLPKEQEKLDYELLRTITGSPIYAEDYGLEEYEGDMDGLQDVTGQDIENFENLSDLYWWFCKMDVYQSILGGTKLFMDYKEWSQIPPRAPVAKFGQIFGTYDHLILLLGRVASFAAKDLGRKRRAFTAPPGPSSGNTPPPFPGIIPVQGAFQTPMGFSPPRQVSPQSEQSDDSDPRAKLDAALEEWESIRKAFEALKDSFGPDFRPLSPEYADRRESPFGLAVQYRTYSISGVWMNYYMGLIHLHRAHPHMPPAAMQAAGMAAKDTATYANQIGRIASGLWADSPRSTPDPLLVAALIECSFCLFVAGVQYQIDSQRHWLIRRMSDVAQYTGWQSAKQIATGCEAVWKKAAQMGRGPPYESSNNTVEEHAQSVWRTARRLDEVFEKEGDKRIVLARADRAQFALGLLAAEEDMARLELRDDST
ncbi:Fungal transcriptional regulatory protein [Akanthomyces lecanii RCEF 1005]|uniref:Fungal transcriptional regulatory protein n=1 Tax=Akanthomyces lecanii RCEF 1005 TaxID=1081108 RepID=A0A162KN34_CORDF|nr:Fungal transcriptional regulatory protein [Akanthomyces lecanii RCEF 1005]